MPGVYYPSDLPFFDGSYYELVTASGLSWVDAQSAVAGMSLEGCTSHLVTITSQAEQDVLYGFFDGDLQGKWYGGFQEYDELVPEAN